MIIDGILVVEGKDDKAFLSSFIESEIVFINGFELNDSVIKYLEKIPSNRTIYIFTDPDDSGKKIRKKLQNLFPKAKNIVIDKQFCDKNGKHGVAEANKDEIIKLLKPYEINGDNNVKENITLSFLYETLGPNFNSVISDKFNLGHATTKQIINRLNQLNITKEDIINLLCK